MRHVGVEAVDGLFAAGGGALVQDARGAVFAGERGCHCCCRFIGGLGDLRDSIYYILFFFSKKKKGEKEKVR